MVQAIVHETEQRKHYFENKTAETIYFGGGTPSLLDNAELSEILEKIHSTFHVHPSAEITIECNPEDLDPEKLNFYKKAGINRLSIGIQTFDNQILKNLNRVHDAPQALKAVKLAQDTGFDNITADLMYALPGSTTDTLKKDLDIAMSLDVPHLSAYCFTLEEKTAFGRMVKQGKLVKNEDHIEQTQYELLHSTLSAHGYEQYEISNFARNERYSRHNTAYWFSKPYLGLGPGAHSFNGSERQWNISNNPIYIRKIQQNLPPYETEILTSRDVFNEAIITRLRTKWGVDMEQLKERTGIELYQLKKTIIDKMSVSGMLVNTGSHLFLTEKGKFVSDGIVVELMI